MSNKTKASIVKATTPREEFGGLVLVSGGVVIRYSLDRSTAQQLADKLAKLLNHLPLEDKNE